MKKLIFLKLFLFFNFTYSADQNNDPDQISRLVKDVIKHKNAFCQKGSVFNESIRSDNGKHCKSELGAALAWAICLDYNDSKGDVFYGSQCWKEASKKLTEYDRKHGSFMQKAFDIIRKKDQKETCGMIGKFIKDLTDKCLML